MERTDSFRLHLAETREDVSSVLQRMKAEGIRHLPVVENGKLVGILSDRDLLLHAWSGRTHEFPEDLTVGDVMTKKVVTAPYGTPVAEICALMLSLKVDALPLTGPKGDLVGIVTSTDVMRLVAARDEELCRVRHSTDFMNQFRWDMPEII